MNRIDPKYYLKKRIERRRRSAFEAFVFIAFVTMFALSILIYIRYGC